MDKKPQDTESRHADKYVLRFPVGMRDRIAEVAKADGRSMNAEIVNRLVESFEERKWPLTPGLMEKAEEAAAKNRRSVDVELLNRFLDSFAEKPEVDRLRGLLEAERKENVKLRLEIEEITASETLNHDVLYILLDSHGYPISWDEIRVYLNEVKKVSGALPSHWETHILTPDMESSSRRAKEASDIAKRLRTEGRSQVLKQPVDDTPPNKGPTRSPNARKLIQKKQ